MRPSTPARTASLRALAAIVLTVLVAGCLAQAAPDASRTPDAPTSGGSTVIPDDAVPETTHAVADVPKRFRGSLPEAPPGAEVAVQQERRGAWRTVATAPVRADGSYLVEYRPGAVGDSRVRLAVLEPEEPARVVVASEPARVVVHKNVASLTDEQTACLGAAAVVDPGCENPALQGLLLPSLDKLESDNGGGYVTDCWQPDRTALVPSCRFGSTDDDATRVALVGDSHAAMYLPGLRTEMADGDWAVDTFLGVDCRWMTYPEGDPCHARQADVQQRLLAGDYDVVVVAGLRHPDDDVRAAAALSRRQATLWREVAEAGAKVLAIGDIGYLPGDALDCVRADGGREAAGCTLSVEASFRGIDPLVDAVALTPDAELVDVSDLVCPQVDGRCPLVVGSAVVYRDKHHLSGTYAKTMAPMLAERLRAAADR